MGFYHTRFITSTVVSTVIENQILQFAYLSGDPSGGGSAVLLRLAVWDEDIFLFCALLCLQKRSAEVAKEDSIAVSQLFAASRERLRVDASPIPAPHVVYKRSSILKILYMRGLNLWASSLS